MTMDVDDRGDEQQVLDQLREILEDVEKRLNRRMMVDIGIKVLGCLALVVLLLLVVAYVGAPK